MSDAEFRALFARFDQEAEPRPESVERLLAEIDRIVGSPGASPDQPDSGVDATTARDGSPPEGAYLVEEKDHGPLAFARARLHRRHVIAALATAAAIIVVTVAVVVTRPGSHRQPNPVAPSPTTVPQPLPVVPPPSPTAIAQPQLYWEDANGIGRANLDGTGITRQLIPVGAHALCGGTIAADRNYVYWTNLRGIARAMRDGTGVDQSFITTSPYVTQCVAVDGAHVYWTSVLGADSTSPQIAIGRANLDGTGVQESFISVAAAFCLAVDGAHIYWSGGKGMGRANLDGTGINQAFIPNAFGCVVDDGAHLYWPGGKGIVRANLDGTGVNDSFITPGGSGALPCAHDSTYLYWLGSVGPRPSAQPPLGTGLVSVGRARLDGTGAQDGFITGLTSASGCAIGP
jgi:hypothetical protein